MRRVMIREAHSLSSALLNRIGILKRDLISEARWSHLLLVVLCSLVMVSITNAQQINATISGHVTNEREEIVTSSNVVV